MRTFARLAAGLVVIALGVHPVGAQDNTTREAGRAALNAGEGAQALSLFVEAADKGDAEAARLAGEVAYLGLGGAAANHVRGCDYFAKAAEGGDGIGAHSLASCFYTGVGRNRDFGEAARWYGEAVRLGVTRSQCALGNMYIRGEGVTRDVVQGLGLCRAAANAGDRDAQFDLGEYYVAGQVVDRDVETAVNWLEQAATQNHANAAFLLGTLIWTGEVEGADRAESARWWRIALLGGRVDAARWLGDSLLLQTMARADAPEALDRRALAAVRAAYDIAAAQDPDPKSRAYAIDRLAAIDALSEAIGSEQ